MPEKNRRCWKNFKVGSLSTKPNWTNPDCVPLNAVTHVTHVSAAVEVMRNGALRAGLVFDESHLNATRILVSWLSPNDWSNAGGFRYGNVAFDFSWTDLVEDLNAYWVGTMDYSPTACRILLTDQDRSEDLLPYHPEQGNGPWWFDKSSGNHYWNGQLCLEFMVEENLVLPEVAGIRFVRHHKHQCCIDPANCPERGDCEMKGGGRFLAACCGQRIRIPKSP